MSKNRLDFTANLGRHSHDVTAGYTSSICPGMIVPQYFDILGPGDKIFYKTHMFARFQNIVNPFLGEVDLHVKYFFVPLQMLYTPFGQIFAQTNDVISSHFNSHVGDADQFPYGDINEYFNSMYNTNKVADDTHKTCKNINHLRLLDALNFNPLVYRNGFDSAALYTIPNGTFFSLLAYQAIYQKAFRNEEVELFDVASFNVDTYFSNNNGKYSITQLDKMLTLRYCGRPQDYFTSVRLSPIATSVNAFAHGSNEYQVDGGSTSGLNDVFKKVSDFLDFGEVSYEASKVAEKQYLGTTDFMNRFGGSYASRYFSEDDKTFYSPLTAQNIRALFALDKYMRVYGRAGKTYDDQILAHFGVKIPHDVKHDLTELKHYRMVLQADPVLNTADTEQGQVGQVGGQVAGELNVDEASFTAPVHGVFMAVAFVQTHPRYYCTNDRLNAINSRLNFPIPEFDKLGAQPMYEYEYGKRVYDPESETLSYSYIWKNRYSEFKEKYNRCSLSYAHDLTWIGQGENFFKTWVVSRRPFGSIYDGEQFIPADFFEQPSALDNVMVTKYNGLWSNDYEASPHLMFQTDPILTEFCCFAKKVSWMSPTGEPDL